jgi:hypothetical protein
MLIKNYSKYLKQMISGMIVSGINDIMTQLKKAEEKGLEYIDSVILDIKNITKQNFIL